MAPAPSASAFPLHPNSCLLDEHDRMLFQHSHPTGTDAERTTLQEGVEGFSAAISKAIQPQSHALHLDQRAGTLPTHHRSNARVPGSSSQATKAAEDQPKYYKELTVRCTSYTTPSGQEQLGTIDPRSRSKVVPVAKIVAITSAPKQRVLAADRKSVGE